MNVKAFLLNLTKITINAPVKVAGMNEQCRVHAGGGDTKLYVESSNLQLLFFFCMSLYTSLYSALTSPSCALISGTSPQNGQL
jgi:hypothetical protein